MKRKALSLVMVVSMILSLICVTPVIAQTSGTCGDNVTWTLDDNGVLTISGTGKMYDYSALNPDPSAHAPWDAESNSIKTVVIEEGIEHIGNAAISGLNIKKIYIPHSVTSIAEYQNSDDEAEIYYNGEHSEFTQIDGFIYLRTRNPNITIYPNTSYNNTSKQEIEEVVQNNREIRILINNKFLSTDQPPVLINDRTMVPLRAIFEALGATVDWNGSEKSVTSKKDDTSVYMQIGNNKITVNGNTAELDVPAQIVNDRTMVPVRAVAEAFDCKVSWNGYQKYVIITPPGQQAYKIEAVNDKDEVLATAHFNDKGQLTNVNGFENANVSLDGTIWFIPMLANINGNCYMDLFWDVPVGATISYDENNVSEIEVNKTTYSYKHTYTYNSDNCIDSAKYVSDSSTGSAIPRTYSSDGKKISYPKYIAGPIVSDLKKTFTLNNMGLAERYDMSESGGSGSLTYDSNGNLTHWTAFFGIDYVYDAQNKLSQATLKELSDPIGISVTYRYINE